MALRVADGAVVVVVDGRVVVVGARVVVVGARVVVVGASVVVVGESVEGGALVDRGAVVEVAGGEVVGGVVPEPLGGPVTDALDVLRPAVVAESPPIAIGVVRVWKARTPARPAAVAPSTIGARLIASPLRGREDQSAKVSRCTLSSGTPRRRAAIAVASAKPTGPQM